MMQVFQILGMTGTQYIVPFLTKQYKDITPGYISAVILCSVSFVCGLIATTMDAIADK